MENADKVEREDYHKAWVLAAESWDFQKSLNYSQAQLLKKMFTQHSPEDVANILGYHMRRCAQTHDRPARTK